MKNIIKVFQSDFRRLSTNVVALVIVMGLSIIPALYAWFNIMSNWDVYGPNATSQMKIGVFSEDEGIAIKSLELNIGEKVVEGLKTNDLIGWEFTDNKEAAIEGVYSGEYYAALIIPEDFTVDMISFIGGDIENPTIQYYENSKKNAIATKITSKAQKAVQEQVNVTFIETLTEVVAKASEALTGMETSDGGLMNTTLNRLHEMDDSLSTYVNLLNTLALVTDSAGDLVESSQAMIPNVESILESSQSTVSGMQGSVLSASRTADALATLMSMSFDNLIKQMEGVSEQVDQLPAIGSYVKASEVIDQLEPVLDHLESILGTVSGQDTSQLQLAIENLRGSMDSIKSNADMTQEELASLQKVLSERLKNVVQETKAVSSSFSNNIAPQLKNVVYNVQDVLVETNSMLNSIDGNFSGINLALEDYKITLDQGTTNISETARSIEEIQGKLQNIISGLEELNDNEAYQEVLELFENNPQMIAQFISSPVEMNTEAVYPISSYGSQMAPFYTVLALWVGGLIVMALVHVHVKPHHDIPADLKPYQAYFGRYITYFLICSAQATITVLGDLYFVQIQCVHPFLFWVGAMCISFAFSLLMYSLTVALGNVGEGIAVILLVIQVAGGGGTFPVEVLPEAFQMIYKFLPFGYAMDAMKECVGGFYRFTYVKCLAVLGIVVLISLFIGLVVTIPFKGLMEKIEESKEKSKVML